MEQQGNSPGYDLIGDVHGCLEELQALLLKLGYEISSGVLSAPHARRCILLGDIVDRGPWIARTLCFVHRAVHDGIAELILGNHDDKLRRALRGNRVALSRSFQTTCRQLYAAWGLTLPRVEYSPTLILPEASQLADSIWPLLQAVQSQSGINSEREAWAQEKKGKADCFSASEREYFSSLFGSDYLQLSSCELLKQLSSAKNERQRRRLADRLRQSIAQLRSSDNLPGKPAYSFSPCQCQSPYHTKEELLEDIKREPLSHTAQGAEPRYLLAVRAVLSQFYESRPIALKLDDDRLWLAHAGLPPEPNCSGHILREFCLYGDVDKHCKDDNGFPRRRDWSLRYTGEARIVHGHVVNDAARWRNNVLDIDTGCVFGGYLTALRWPELELVQVKSGVCVPHQVAEG